MGITEMDFSSQAFAQLIFEVNDVRVAGESIARTVVRQARGGAPGLQSSNERFGLADVEGFFEDTFGSLLLLFFAGQTKNDFGMANRKLTGTNQLLNGCGKLQEAKRIGHQRAAFADLGSDFFLGQAELLN